MLSKLEKDINVLLEKHRLSEERFSKIFEASPNALIMADSNGVICLLNQEAENLFGYSRIELIGEKIEILIPSKFHKSHPKFRNQYVSNPQKRSMGSGMDLYGLRKDGSEVAIEIGLNPLETNEGSFVLASIIDITERLKSENEILNLQQEKLCILDSMLEGLHGIDVNGNITFLNVSASRMLGWEIDELIGKSAHDSIHHSNLDGNSHLKKDCPILKTLQDGLVRKSSRNEVFWRKDGTYFLVEYSISPVFDSKKTIKGVLVSFVDCTGKIESKEELDNFSDLSPHMMSILGYNGELIRINNAWKKTLGYNPNDLLDKSIYDYIHDDDLIIVNSNLNYIKEKGAINALEIRLKHKNGKYIWTLWSIVSDIQKQKIFAIGRDISENKKQEKELIEAKEKAESADYLKSAFLAIMSHELRTPLNSIIGFTSIINSGLAGPINEEQKKQLTMVLKSSKHLLTLINDVLDISKIEAGQLEVENKAMDLTQSIKKSIDIVKPLLEKKELKFVSKIDLNLGVIKSDQRRIEQIIINILTNAVKFTEKGTITLKAEKQEQYTSIKVIDTGEGIKPENLKQLFVPFKQVNGGITRPQEGTGLGLSICDKIIYLLGGEIVVESEFGKGSIFEIRIPNNS